MGTCAVGRWGVGNFDEDAAADHLSGVTGKLIEEVERAMAGDPGWLEPDEYWGVAVPCNLELLLVLRRQGYVGLGLPGPAVIEGWKETFLGVFDATIDGLEPTPAFKRDRRAVLERTFDDLIAVAADD